MTDLFRTANHPLTSIAIGSLVLTLLIAGRRWSNDVARPDTRPPGLIGVLRRVGTRAQLQRPALVPVTVTFVVLALATLARAWGTPASDVAALQNLSSAYAGAMLTIFTLLAGLTAGFTFVVIGTVGSTYSPLLSDPAIRAPRFWWFLAFSMAGMIASVFLLLLPPRASVELAMTMVCLTLSLITLTLYLRGAALDANPATLLRRLTDNDVPPAGFRSFAHGRPVQIGLAVVRAALQQRDGPTAAAATYEVVRACAHFQHALMRKPATELADPARGWGIESIAEVQNEFRQWIDELNDSPSTPTTAYDAAGRLLAYPLIWEATLDARLDQRADRDAEEDLGQPLHTLIATGATDADGSGAPVPLRRMTLTSAVLGGALRSILDAQAALHDEGARSAALASVRDTVTADLAHAALRLSLQHVEGLRQIKPTDRYGTRLIATTQQRVAGMAADAIASGGRQAIEHAVKRFAVVPADQPSPRAFAQPLLAVLHVEPGTRRS